jgi:hypothetical protein
VDQIYWQTEKIDKQAYGKRGDAMCGLMDIQKRLPGE